GQAASDLRPETVSTAPAPVRTDVDESHFDVVFAKAIAALKARSFEESRLLFSAAADLTDINKMPLSWQTAQFNACHALCLQGRMAEAETLARQIEVRCEAALGLEDPLTNEALSYLAFVLKQNGHLEGAEPVYRRCVQALEAKYGSEHYLVAAAISKHAGLLQSLGKLTEAESLQRKALAIVQKVGIEDHPDICYFLTNLAYCLQASQKTEEANELMQKAFDIVQDRSDKELASAGSILRKQAEFYRNQQQFDRAETLGHRALLRLAKRPDINRARFFYYDLVADVYRSILQARGLDAGAIEERFHQLDAEVMTAKATASASR
ncbi:MAG: Tetratricopeptide 2 repeat protein, partial [Verrucomicrobiaceae bacterium]|nr:Tetratricopeptide 2 repeat protein [Verrucomicrobiaceae bacterium]